LIFKNKIQILIFLIFIKITIPLYQFLWKFLEDEISSHQTAYVTNSSIPQQMQLFAFLSVVIA